MKRSICWILAALFLLAVVACGSNAAEGPVTDAAHSPAPKETQDDVIAVVVTPPPTQEARMIRSRITGPIRRITCFMGFLPKTDYLSVYHARRRIARNALRGCRYFPPAHFVDIS